MEHLKRILKRLNPRRLQQHREVIRFFSCLILWVDTVLLISVHPSVAIASMIIAIITTTLFYFDAGEYPNESK